MRALRLTTALRPFQDVAASAALRRVALAFAGFAIAEIGIWVAMLVVAYEAGGTAVAGLVGVVQLLPAALVARFAALPADRYRRDRVLTAGYLLTAVTVGATAIALFAEAPFALVYALAALATVATTMARPAQAALLPELARTPEELAATTVTVGAIESMSLFAGPAAAGILLSAAGAGGAFTGMALLLLGSTLLALSIRSRRSQTSDADEAAAADIAAGFLGGFRVTIREPEPRLIVGVLAAHAVVRGALDVLIVVLAFDLLTTGSGGVGFLNAAYGAGAILGSAATVALVGRRRIAPVLLAGGLAWAIALGVIGLSPHRASAPFLLALAGIGRTQIEVAGRLLLLRGVPNRVLARVFGVLEGLGLLGLAVGLLAAPALTETISGRAGFMAFALLLPAVLVLGWRRLAAIDAKAVIPEAELRLLRTVPIFAPLSPTVLERLARQLIRVDQLAGATVIQQGDHGDRFYILAEGEVDVTIDDRHVDAHGPGGFFGEVALLRDVPRTASVIARTPVRLYALERGDFLEAVTGHAASHAAAEEVVRARYDDRTSTEPQE